MPEGTPLLAVTDAVVMTAGLEAPNVCPPLNRTVQALLVVLIHTAPPHLHFGVGRRVAGRYVLIDPYGWHAPTEDPWQLDPRGAASVWLWKDGATRDAISSIMVPIASVHTPAG
jgi:hypothetical protein